MVRAPISRFCILTATLPGMLALQGCMPGQASMTAAAGEPASGVTIALTVRGDAYDIDRWYPTESLSLWQGRPLSVPRGSVPADCPAARFVIDDAGAPLAVAEPVAPGRITAVEPPRPVGEDVRCTLRVAHGAFEVPERREGLVVTAPGGVVAYAPREPAHPGYYALAPAEAYLSVWGSVALVLASPVVVPYAMASNKKAEKKRASAEAALPPEVAACWRAAEALMAKAGPENPQRRYMGLLWAPAHQEAWSLRAEDRPADPAPEARTDDDTRAVATLNGAQVTVDVRTRVLHTDADIDCVVQAGRVTTAAVRLRN